MPLGVCAARGGSGDGRELPCRPRSGAPGAGDLSARRVYSDEGGWKQGAVGSHRHEIHGTRQAHRVRGAPAMQAEEAMTAAMFRELSAREP